MTDSNQISQEDFLSLTTEIVCSYFSNNSVSPQEVPVLVQQVYTTLANLASAKAAADEKLKPAVSVNKSVTPDYLICLEDGKKLKMLRRYLKTTHNMTPEEYRARWNLPKDYPMVAPNYAKKRSSLAKQIGLGQKKTATRGRKPGKKAA